MKISTKGRYALRVLIDLAESDRDKNISIREIAERQEISDKYLEGIVSKLSSAGFVVSTRGKYGGYRLAKDPKDSNLYDILKATEESMAVVSCLETEVNTCEKQHECKTLPFWSGMQQHINAYLKTVTLQDVLEGKVDPLAFGEELDNTKKHC